MTPISLQHILCSLLLPFYENFYFSCSNFGGRFSCHFLWRYVHTTSTRKSTCYLIFTTYIFIICIFRLLNYTPQQHTRFFFFCNYSFVLTSHNKLDRIARSFPFWVGGHAGVVPCVGPPHALQNEAVVAQDDTAGDVVEDFHALIKQFVF